MRHGIGIAMSWQLQDSYKSQRRALGKEMEARNRLEVALAEVKVLSGVLPICGKCKKIRNEQGDWESIEAYVGSRSEADFSHGACPECQHTLYPDIE